MRPLVFICCDALRNQLIWFARMQSSVVQNNMLDNALEVALTNGAASAQSMLNSPVGPLRVAVNPSLGSFILPPDATGSPTHLGRTSSEDDKPSSAGTHLDRTPSEDDKPSFAGTHLGRTSSEDDKPSSAGTQLDRTPSGNDKSSSAGTQLDRTPSGDDKSSSAGTHLGRTPSGNDKSSSAGTHLGRTSSEDDKGMEESGKASDERRRNWRSNDKWRPFVTYVMWILSSDHDDYKCPEEVAESFLENLGGVEGLEGMCSRG